MKPLVKYQLPNISWFLKVLLCKIFHTIIQEKNDEQLESYYCLKCKNYYYYWKNFPTKKMTYKGVKP